MLWNFIKDDFNKVYLHTVYIWDIYSSAHFFLIQNDLQLRQDTTECLRVKGLAQWLDFNSEPYQVIHWATASSPPIYLWWSDVAKKKITVIDVLDAQYLSCIRVAAMGLGFNPFLSQEKEEAAISIYYSE